MRELRRLDDIAREIQTEHHAAHATAQRAMAHARTAGALLNEAKQRLNHGEWLPWLRDHCGDLAPRTAQVYMRLARLTDEEAQRVADLSLRDADRALRNATPSAVPDLLFSHNRIEDAAFEHFRRTGFPYRQVPVHVAMQALNKLAAMGLRALLSSTIAYDVADSYHPHRFRATGRGKLSPTCAFERDHLLRRALRKALEQNQPIPAGYFGGLSIVSGAQPRSNFRPGIALNYYRRFSRPGATVLDTSTGYGGRLVGFLASGFGGRYVGLDPNRDTHDGNARLAADLGFADVVELHCVPAEDLDPAIVRNRCDFALTSPPYFTKEHYSNDPTQSWVRYPTPDAWREGFLRPMLRLQFEALKSGSFNVINIDDVRIDKTTHALTDWTRALAVEVGFELVDVEQLTFPAPYWSTAQGIEDTSEPVFIFRKP